MITPDDATIRGYERHAEGWAEGGGVLGEAGRAVLELAAEVRRLRSLANRLAGRVADQSESLGLRAERPSLCNRCLRPLAEGQSVFCSPGCRPGADSGG